MHHTHLAGMHDVGTRCETLLPQLEKIAGAVVECLRGGGKIPARGNGGSA
jgi:phosphoheptose isomerase